MGLVKEYLGEQIVQQTIGDIYPDEKRTPA